MTTQFEPEVISLNDVEMYKIPLFTIDALTNVKGGSGSDVKLEQASLLWTSLETKGKDINVAIVDTGVDINHRNMKDRVKLSLNFASDLKVCLDTLGLRETSRFDYFIKVCLLYTSPSPRD